MRRLEFFNRYPYIRIEAKKWDYKKIKAAARMTEEENPK
jgi:hypothetical protein